MFISLLCNRKTNKSYAVHKGSPLPDKKEFSENKPFLCQIFSHVFGHLYKNWETQSSRISHSLLVIHHLLSHCFFFEKRTTSVLFSCVFFFLCISSSQLTGIWSVVLFLCRSELCFALHFLFAAFILAPKKNKQKT